MENYNFTGKIHYKLPFSIDMFVFQRVSSVVWEVGFLILETRDTCGPLDPENDSPMPAGWFDTRNRLEH